MSLFSRNKPKADPEKIQQIKTWAYQILAVDAETLISISQLACREPGCPPIETVITVMTHPVQQYKLHKAANDIQEADLYELTRKLQ
jgi:hypothetical protein